MNAKQDFLRLMASQTDAALATSTESQPNVRIVNFHYDESQKILYFATFKGNDKVKEIEENSNIAFTTTPQGGYEHVRAKGVARRSKLSIFDVAEAFIQKIPDYKDIVEQAGSHLLLFEVTFEEATVTLNFEESSTVRI
jgi:uncharacterized pyridoxamine 5'-phosphate oxidase family protein